MVKKSSFSFNDAVKGYFEPSLWDSHKEHFKKMREGKRNLAGKFADSLIRIHLADIASKSMPPELYKKDQKRSFLDDALKQADASKDKRKKEIQDIALEAFENNYKKVEAEVLLAVKPIEIYRGIEISLEELACDLYVFGIYYNQKIDDIKDCTSFFALEHQIDFCFMYLLEAVSTLWSRSEFYFREQHRKIQSDLGHEVQRDAITRIIPLFEELSKKPDWPQHEGKQITKVYKQLKKEFPNDTPSRKTVYNYKKKMNEPPC